MYTYVGVFQVRSPFPLDVSSRGGVQDDVTALRRGLHQEAHQDLGENIEFFKFYIRASGAVKIY